MYTTDIEAATHSTITLFAPPPPPPPQKSLLEIVKEMLTRFGQVLSQTPVPVSTSQDKV
jgi:hypothetical protein